MSQFAVAWSTVALAIAGVLSVARVLRQGSVADRTIGLDMLVVVLAAAFIVGAASTGRTLFLTVVTVVALLAFVATVTIARFLEPPPSEQSGEGFTSPSSTVEGEPGR